MGCLADAVIELPEVLIRRIFSIQIKNPVELIRVLWSDRHIGEPFSHTASLTHRARAIEWVLAPVTQAMELILAPAVESDADSQVAAIKCEQLFLRLQGLFPRVDVIRDEKESNLVS